METIERFKVKAETFLKNNTQTFIEDISHNYFFCEIVRIDRDFLIIENFAGKRSGEVDKIYFSDILRFEEYEEKGEVGGGK